MKNIITNVKSLLKGSGLLVLLVLLSTSKASAAPIASAGGWSPVAGINNDHSPFWDGLSLDCPMCNVGSVVDEYNEGLTGLEYLNNGSGDYVRFRFEEPTIAWTFISSNTAWSNGVLGQAGGAFTYDSGTRPLSNSWENPQQYALFRLVGVDTTRYFMGIEDIPVGEPGNDLDYNDYVVTFTLPNQPVPEPSTLLLVGISIFGLAARRARRSTKTSTV